MGTKHHIDLFDSQFQRQIQSMELALNPFEKIALEHAVGSVLDLGCGLGNLALQLARLKHAVVAVDGSLSAIEHIQHIQAVENLSVEAIQADLDQFMIAGQFDTIIAIGLLMFFRKERAHALLGDIQAHIKPGGCAIINVLTEETTYLGMFQPGHYYLFGRHELEEKFSGWDIQLSERHVFPAPDNTEKVFATLIAYKN